MKTSADSTFSTAGAQPDFRAIFESAPGLLLILTPELRIVAVSNSYLRATKTSREQIVGHHVFDVFPDNPNDPNASGVRNLKASLERVLQNKTPDTMPVQKYDIRRPESEGGGFEERYWSPVNAPVAGKDGNVEYIIHRVEDVTDFFLLKERRAEDLKASEELRTVASRLETELYLRARELDRANQELREGNQELARLYEKAQGADQLKSHFFASVSHELRTPLTLILSPVEELLKNADASVPVTRSDLELLRRNGLRLLRLVNNLLDLSRIEAGRLSAEYVPTDLAALTADCASMFQSVVESAGLWFRLDLQPLGETVYVDRSMWEKIVLNLLSNAFKFTLRGGITVTLTKVDNGAQLSVMDSGIGIPEEELLHIFERFHRVKGARGRTFEGTGIGLALADELVRLHGGTIGVQSVPNQGTTFTVSIPFAAAHPRSTQISPGQVGITPTARAAYSAEAKMWEIRVPVSESSRVISEIGKSPEPFAGGSRPRIVFADDNADMRAYIAQLLGEDYEVEAAGNGEQALAAIDRRCPDLVLSDVMMPVMDGFELLRALRSDPRTQTVPMVLLSARTHEDSRIEGLEYGADDYLVKPFTAPELRARVRSHIRLARLRKEVELRLSGLNSELEQRIQERTASLREREELLQTFVRHVPAAVAMFDREMRYLQCSDRWCVDFSLRSDEIMGRSHYHIFPDIPERWKEIHRRCLAGETLRADEDCWDRAEGDATWLRWEMRPWGERDGKPEGVLIFSEDITARKRMEATLRESEATTRTLLETAAQAILAVDVRGAVVLANRMAEEMFGYGRDEVLGGPLERLLPERLREGHAAHRSDFEKNPRTRPMGIGLDLQGIRKNGTEFPIEVSLSAVGTSRGPLAVAFVTDITLRKQAETALRNSETELRALARSLITAQEDERRRVARDLHDDVTQRLALLSIDIGKLAAGIPRSVAKVKTQLRSFQNQTLQVSNELRRLSHGLHPSVIEDFGLSVALEEFCKEFAQAQGLNLRFDGPAAGERLRGEGASCLYRVAQECLQNAAKHARATQVRVGLTIDGANMELLVRDNGVGFAVAAGRVNSGLGLVSMKERIRMANGTLSITSQPGQGTEIAASVPLSGV